MSEIRYVTVPADITVILAHPQTGLPAAIERDFETFVKERTRDAVVFGRNLDGIMTGVAVRQAFASCQPGDVIGLPLDQWQALCQATREPQDGYNPEVMFQVLPHAQAILDAPTTRPKRESQLAPAAE